MPISSGLRSQRYSICGARRRIDPYTRSVAGIVARLDRAGAQHAGRLAWASTIVVVLAGVAALPMAFGMIMSPSDPNELSSFDNPWLFLLAALLSVAGGSLISSLALLVGRRPADRYWSARFSTTAIAVGGLIVGAFTAEMAYVVLG